MFAAKLELGTTQLNTIWRTLILIFALLVVAGITNIDFLVGIDISLSLFYLVPVSVVTWHLGRILGVFVAFVSALAVAAEHVLSNRWVLQPFVVLWQSILHTGFMLIFIFLLDRLHTALINVNYLASTDSLTGVLNRRAFIDRFTYLLHLSAREMMPITLTYIDLDNFKQINDEKGHAEGDRVLRCIASTLTDTVRSTDLVCRLGGDEFALLLPDADRRSAEQFIAKLKQALSIAFYSEFPIVTCSIGCITFRQPPLSPEIALEAADSLMYKVKRSGKNEIAFKEIGSQNDIK